jgi:CheY-like chemotaxis protein
MRVLLVEDDEDQADILTNVLAIKSAPIQVVLARSRDSAIDELSRQFFDFVLCDLKIPTVDGGLDAALEHGIDVQRHISEAVSGTPSYFFSAFGSELVIGQHVIPFAAQGDPFMTGSQRPMLDVRSKIEINRVVDELVGMASAVDAIEQVSIESDADLSETEARLIKLVAYHDDAVVAQVEVFPEGLSEARTFKVNASGKDMSPRLRAAVKVDVLANLASEELGFSRLASVLGSQVMATQAFVVREGADGLGAIVYSLATDHVSLFRIIAEDTARALATLQALRGELDSRIGEGPAQDASVLSIRRLFLSDDEARTLYPPDLGIDFDKVESKTVAVRYCILHRDLHGANILVDADGRPLLIDFAAVVDGPASLDPVLLEMSLVFHPYGRRVLGSPEELVESDWTDQESYCAAVPSSEVASFCRDWAYEVAGSEGEVLAVAYGWALRQLMYEKSNGPLARRIVQVTASRLLQL